VGDADVEQVGAAQHLLDLSVGYAKSRLQFGHLGDAARGHAMEHIGVAAAGAGRGAWRIEQDRVERFGRLPFQRIGGDNGGGKAGAGKVLPQQLLELFVYSLLSLILKS